MAGEEKKGGEAPTTGRAALTLMTLWAFILVATWITVAIIMAKRGWFYGA